MCQKELFQSFPKSLKEQCDGWLNRLGRNHMVSACFGKGPTPGSSCGGGGRIRLPGFRDAACLTYKLVQPPGAGQQVS